MGVLITVNQRVINHQGGQAMPYDAPVREHILTLIFHCIIRKNTVATKQYMYLVRNKLLLVYQLIKPSTVTVAS